MFINIIRYIKGEVDFKATIPDSAGFIKEMQTVGKVRSIYCNGINLYGTCGVKTYKRITPLVKKYGGRRRIIKRRGIRFQIYRRKKRIGIPIGIIAAVMLLIICSQFIWRVSVVGEGEIAAALKKALPEYGIKNGMYKRGIDTRLLEAKILADFPEISFVAINISGAEINIEIDETNLSPIKPSGKYGNIIALTEGKIVSYNVYNGIRLVNEGDYVFKGELLVSGTYEDYFGRTIFLNSQADIYAEREETLTLRLPKNTLLEKETGKVIKKRYISLFGVNLPIHLNFFTKGFYNDTVVGKRMMLFGKEMPIFYTDVTLSEVEYISIEEEYSVLCERGREMISEELKSFNDKKNITLKNISFSENENEVIVTAEFTAVENIAKYVEFSVE